MNALKPASHVQGLLDSLVLDMHCRMVRKQEQLARRKERQLAIDWAEHEVALAKRNLERVGELRERVLALVKGAAECMSTELGEIACAGSMAPCEDALGQLQRALADCTGGAK